MISVFCQSTVFGMSVAQYGGVYRFFGICAVSGIHIFFPAVWCGKVRYGTAFCLLGVMRCGIGIWNSISVPKPGAGARHETHS